MALRKSGLPEKKFRGRKRGFPLIRSLLFAGVIFVTFKLIPPPKNEKQLIQEATLIPDISQVKPKFQETFEKPLDHFLTHVVKPGETFSSILSGCEVSTEWASDILRSLKPIGLPMLFPGDSLVVKKDPEGKPKELELLSKTQCRYQVTLSDSMIKAQKCALEMSSYTCVVNGVLETSLSEEMQKYGVSDVITSKLADIFAWDINFFLDPRKGDTFQILFEQKYAEGRFAGYGNILAARYVNNGKVFSAFGFSDKEGRIRYFDENGKALQKQFLKAPLRFNRISSGFSFKRKHPVLGIVRPHLGIDYAAPAGTPVYAAADGKVTLSGWNGGYGKMVIISHGGVYETYYGHLRSIHSKAKVGARIAQGELLGYVGATGLATGPHLDYRMKRHGQFVNPSTISIPSSGAVEPQMAAEYQLVKESYLAALELRFSKQLGLHILDIETAQTGEPVVHQIYRTTGLSNGISSGS